MSTGDFECSNEFLGIEKAINIYRAVCTPKKYL